MEKAKADLHAISALSTHAKGVLCGVVALLLVLVIALCISSSMRANIQRDYTAARDQAGEALYSNLHLLMQTFDMTSVTNADMHADVQNAVLPQMREYFTASVTLNNLLGQTYGPKYSVLTDSDVNDITNAFAAYDTAYRSGASTDLAQSNMRLCMDRVQELLDSRYSGGTLRPAR